MRRTLLYLGLLVAYAIPAGAQGTIEKLERLMDGYARNERFNGSVLVAKKGIVLLSKGYGYRDMEKQWRNDESSIYRVGRLTETFTSEMILQLDSKGKLGLDDLVMKYVPDFPEGHKISLRHLLTHTFGISGYVADPVPDNKVCVPITPDHFAAAYKNRPLLFEPGSVHAYSNANYILLGFVIQKIMVVTSDEMISEKFLGTCGMHQSGFGFAQLKDDHKAIGYYEAGGKYTPAPVGDTSVYYPANGLYSTTADLYKWHQALHWYKLLPKDWQDIAYVPAKSQFALGWTIERIGNKVFEESEGNIGGFASTMIRQEEDDVFIVVLENRTQDGKGNSAVAKAIVRSLYGTEPKKVEKAEKKETPAATKNAAPAAGPSIKKFVGEYLFNSSYALSIKLMGDKLMVESPDQEAIELTEESPYIYKTAGANVRLEFVPDKSGNVNKAILHQNGQDYAGQRKK